MGDVPSAGDWIDDGVRIRELLADAMHGEIDPRGLDEREVAHWQKYGRGLERIAVGMGMPGVLAWHRNKSR